jgi:NADH dehydrogenase
MIIGTEKGRILILGGGFAGAYTALHLERELASRNDVEVMMVTHENFLLFTPMLHEVAAGDVDLTDIVQPLRKLLRRTQVLVGEVEMIDIGEKKVVVSHSNPAHAHEFYYSELVLAVGSVTNFYHIPGLEEHALTMKTLGDAMQLRNRLIDSLEIADNECAAPERENILTYVVAGGGFAGVETVGAIMDFLRAAIKFYPNLKQEMLRVVLVHPGEVVLPELGESLGRYTQNQLGRRQIEIHLKTKVVGFNGRELTLDNGTKIGTNLLVWTAGTTPPAVLSSLPCKKERGRILANDSFRVEGYPGVWALGDCALIPDSSNPGHFHPPTAQHAIREAAVLARNIAASLGGRSLARFEFKTIGLLASIGRRCGVAQICGIKFSGFLAWWLWRSIYLSKLPGIEKRVRVMLAWTLDLIFSKDIVQFQTFRAQTVSVDEDAAVSGSKTPSTHSTAA